MSGRAARLKVDEAIDGDVVRNELRDVAPEIRTADRWDVTHVARTSAITSIERRRLEALVHERVEPFGNARRIPPDVCRSDLPLEHANLLDVSRRQPVAAFVSEDRGVWVLAHE